MDWRRRSGRPPPLDVPASAEPAPQPVESAAPGVAAVLHGVSEDRTHAVLDLGAATESSLRFYSRFARWVRFADMFGDSTWPTDRDTAVGLKVVVPHPERPYDLVFVWDALDRLFPEDRPHLSHWLANLTAPDARLHMIVRKSEDADARPFRFTLLDGNRIKYEPVGTAHLPRPRILPAEVAKLITPLRVLHAFSLKTGLREYVVARGA